MGPEVLFRKQKDVNGKCVNGEGKVENSIGSGNNLWSKVPEKTEKDLVKH